jgi:hypothetical protein
LEFDADRRRRHRNAVRVPLVHGTGGSAGIRGGCAARGDRRGDSAVLVATETADETEAVMKSGTRVKTRRTVLANFRHKKGMLEIKKGTAGTVDEIVRDTATVRFDRIGELIAITIANIETEDFTEGHHE